MIGIIQLNLQIKQQTIAAIKAGNVNLAVAAADDEDRSSLVLGWYQPEYTKLAAQEPQMVALMNELVKEYTAK